MLTNNLDCIIIGGGPAGLTAALYLARFRRNIYLIDGGKSRVLLIPLSHNYPTYPIGITGEDILHSMRKQVLSYGVNIINENVLKIKKENSNTFKVYTESSAYLSSFVLMATGIIDQECFLPGLEKLDRKSIIRHCPICDGYEAINKRVAVIGADDHAAREAIFLRTYSNSITLFTLGTPLRISSVYQKELKQLNVRLVTASLKNINKCENNLHAFLMEDKATYLFEMIYFALGAKAQTELALKLGANSTEEGCLKVDAHYQTSVEGLYAAGDIVEGLNQICIASGQAAIAATAIHNKLKNNYC